MKLEVGMYVRTNNGIIEKLTNKTMLNGKNGHYFTRKDRDECYAKEDILKSSFNLIDLIEVGDYVNGKLIHKIQIKNDGTKLLEYGNGKHIKIIKEVLTHEQYEANCYKVVE